MDFGINQLAHQQIASRLGIPLKYYQRMQTESPALLDKNVNNWLEQTPARRMIRVMDGEGTTEQVREVILEKLDEVISNQKRLKEDLAVKENAFSLDIPSKTELEACFIEVRKMFRAKTLSDMQNLIDLYVEKIIVYEDEIEVILNLVPLFYRKDFTRQVYKISRKKLIRK